MISSLVIHLQTYVPTYEFLQPKSVPSVAKLFTITELHGAAPVNCGYGSQ